MENVLTYSEACQMSMEELELINYAIDRQIELIKEQSK